MSAQDPAPFLRITEIFHSIQGESTWSGLPCTFVRITGCPLRCTWCDTEYGFHGGERMSLDAILERVHEIGCDLVEVTGGEPLAHPNAFVLIERLLDEGHTVLVETSGAIAVEPVDDRAHLIMDLKCPGSGESEKNLWSNISHLGPGDEVKFVVADRADFDWAVEVVRERGLDARVRDGALAALLISPVQAKPGDAEAGVARGPKWREVAEWVLASDLPLRFQIQLHKEIWDADEKGV